MRNTHITTYVCGPSQTGKVARKVYPHATTALLRVFLGTVMHQQDGYAEDENFIRTTRNMESINTSMEFLMFSLMRYDIVSSSNGFLPHEMCVTVSLTERDNHNPFPSYFLGKSQKARGGPDYINFITILEPKLVSALC